MTREWPGTTSESGRITAEYPASEIATAGARIADLLSEGLAHHQAGRLVEAEVYYWRILAVTPAYADALHLLGVIASRTIAQKWRSN